MHFGCVCVDAYDVLMGAEHYTTKPHQIVVANEWNILKHYFVK